MKDCSTKSILIVSSVTFLILGLILAVIVYFVLFSGGDDSDDDTPPTGACPNLKGVFYGENNDADKTALFTIGTCTDENGEEKAWEPPEDADNEIKNGNDWNMCGSFFVNGYGSSPGGGISLKNNGTTHCSDVKFRYDDKCKLQAYSQCLSDFTNKKYGPKFPSDNSDNWTISDDGKSVTLARGNIYKSINEKEFKNTYEKGNGPSPSPSSCVKVDDQSKCDKKFTRCKGFTKSGCCCDNEDDTSCCDTSQNISFKLKLARSLGLAPEFL